MREDESRRRSLLRARGFPLDQQQANVKDIEVRFGGGEEDEVAVTETLPQLRELLLREAPKAQRSRGEAGDAIHSTDEAARPATACEIREKPLADILANPFDHVVVPCAPGEPSVLVANAPQPSSDVTRRSGQSEREHRLHIRDAIEAREREGEVLALIRPATERILDVRTTAQESSGATHSLAERSAAAQLAQERGDLLRPCNARRAIARMSPPRSGHPQRLYDIGDVRGHCRARFEPPRALQAPLDLADNTP